MEKINAGGRSNNKRFRGQKRNRKLYLHQLNESRKLSEKTAIFLNYFKLAIHR